MTESPRVDPRAGQPAQPSDLVDISRLTSEYYEAPDPSLPAQRVLFGTSGHRGSSLRRSFNQAHILAISQAICDFRKEKGIAGPLFLGRDSHALSEPAMISALEVFAANDVTVCVDSLSGLTPTPAVSHAILKHNRQGEGPLADGVVITPSHNPPEDGGFKYNPPNGGPAGSEITRRIEDRANELLSAKPDDVRRKNVRPGDTTYFRPYDFLDSYVADLPSVIDLDAIRVSGVRIGADPLGGASVAYWQEIASRYRLNLTVVNSEVDPAWSFLTLDWDGRLRTDCSSPYAMASLISMRNDYDVAMGNDADADRHGVVTPEAGLMNPNRYLAVAIDYLFRHRDGWSPAAAVGKTLVSSSMIDRVAAAAGRTLLEVPVGFKWFVPGLETGELGFGGEESAGAAFLRRDGSVWTTDKDGISLALLAAEITAVTQLSPSEHYAQIEGRFGPSFYARVDQLANGEQKAKLGKLSADQVKATELAGEPIVDKLTTAPGNGAAIDGLKVVSASGWFAARPSGTEDLYKIYAESYQGPEHLRRIQEDATRIVADVLAA